MKHKLIEADDLWLSDYGDLNGKQAPAAVVRRLIKSFGKVWEQIPLDNRQHLLKHWRRNSRGLPEIAIQSVLRMGCLAAACSGSGDQISFTSEFLRRKTQKQLAQLVAHELGHAMSFANNWQTHHHCQLLPDGECVACELQAYSYMAAWGFDPFDGKLPKSKKGLADRFALAKRR